MSERFTDQLTSDAADEISDCINTWMKRGIRITARHSVLGPRQMDIVIDNPNEPLAHQYIITVKERP